jgi:hypothetical protein
MDESGDVARRSAPKGADDVSVSGNLARIAGICGGLPRALQAKSTVEPPCYQSL